MFVEDVTADRCIRMDSEVYRAILSAHIQPITLLGRCFAVEMDNASAKASQHF